MTRYTPSVPKSTGDFAASSFFDASCIEWTIEARCYICLLFVGLVVLFIYPVVEN